MQIDNETISKLGEKLLTKDAMVSLMSDLESLIDVSYKSDSKMFDVACSDINTKYDSVLALAGTNLSQPQILSFVRDLITYIKAIEPVDITLAFDPPKQFVKKIYLELIDVFSFPFCLNFNLDEEICGGLLISYKGIYTDLSLKKKIADYLSENRENVFAKL
jgi:F0F1-type ATP synthase delta subunit